jgi:trehalose 6-phosphate synthase
MNARRRLLVASNRGPLQYRTAPDGSRVARRGGGGLVTALAGLAATQDVTWVASALSDEDREVVAESGGTSFDETDRAGNPLRVRLVVHDPADYDRYYNVFANPMLWFLQHQLWPLALQPQVDTGTWAAWDAYRIVNDSIAAAVAEEHERLGGEVSVMVHDYQLYLVPAAVRSAAPEAFISHFVHIPWPDPNAWRVLPEPMRVAIGESLLACDVVGFHAARWARAFFDFCRDIIGAEVDDGRRVVRHAGRETRVRVYPISVDTDEFEQLAASEAVAEAGEAMFPHGRPERVILRVDRTDPSKNVVRGFHAFDLFLQQHPEWLGRVRMLALLDPSRQDIPEYAEYLGAVQRAARQIGERWTDAAGEPAIDLRIHDNFPEVVAAYRMYDVLLVNVLYDGMNLVAKEAPLVNVRDGVLILSENAGAFAELGALALPVNPFDLQAQADAIAQALDMPHAERRRRSEAIRVQVREHDISRWIEAQLADLDALGARA